MVQDSIDQGKSCRKRLEKQQKWTSDKILIKGIETNKFDAAMVVRRDEEKARAKERFFHRDEFGQWDPKPKT